MINRLKKLMVGLVAGGLVAGLLFSPVSQIFLGVCLFWLIMGIVLVAAKWATEWYTGELDHE